MSAMKANLHAAAELLGMDPDDLLAKLDPPVPATWDRSVPTASPGAGRVATTRRRPRKG